MMRDGLPPIGCAGIKLWTWVLIGLFCLACWVGLFALVKWAVS